MNATSETSGLHGAFIAASTAFVLLALLHLYMACISSKNSSEKAKKLVSLCACSCTVETGHALVVVLKFIFFQSEEAWCQLIEVIGLSSAAVARSCAYWMLKHRIRYLNYSNDNFRFSHVFEFTADLTSAFSFFEAFLLTLYWFAFKGHHTVSHFSLPSRTFVAVLYAAIVFVHAWTFLSLFLSSVRTCLANNGKASSRGETPSSTRRLRFRSAAAMSNSENNKHPKKNGSQLCVSMATVAALDALVLALNFTGALSPQAMSMVTCCLLFVTTTVGLFVIGSSHSDVLSSVVATRCRQERREVVATPTQQKKFEEAQYA